MENFERRGFFSRDNDAKKKNFLRMLGVDVRVDMNLLLKKGMQKKVVKRVFRKGITWDNYSFYVGKTEILTASKFNGQGYTHLYCNFVNDKLYNWGAYPNQIWDEEAEINAECAKISRELGKIIERSESMASIRNKFEIISKQNAQILKILDESEKQKMIRSRDTLNPSSHRWLIRDYERKTIIATLRLSYLLADIVKTEADDDDDDSDDSADEKVLLGYKLRFREPTDIEHHREITHWHYDVPFGDRVIRYTIKFKDRRVSNWYANPIPKEY